jgi:uncharacterized protein YjbJ (UPF0337 family)
MTKRYTRITASDITNIVAELDRWALGHLGSKLTWAILEGNFGFSRQSLQDKSEIKAAYDNAKDALSGGLIKKLKDTSVKNCFGKAVGNELLIT